MTRRRRHTVAALVPQHVSPFELAVPCEVFGLDRSELASPWYRFLVCADKPDCNENRPVEDEASCVSSLPFVEGAQGRKVCRPSMCS